MLIYFIANILSKSSAVPVYCLFDFACFFFSFYGKFFCIFYRTETGLKDEHSKNKRQNINCYKSSKALCMLSRFCVSNGNRCLSPLGAKNKTLPSVQIVDVMSEKVAVRDLAVAKQA